MADPNQLLAQLKVLSDGYAAQLPEKLAQLEQTWQLLHKDNWDEAGFDIFYRSVHSLSGSGKIFGFSLLSDVARNFESFLKPLGLKKTALNAEQCNHIQVLICELHQVALHRDNTSADELAAILPQKPNAGFRHVYVLEADLAQAEELKVQLSYFGYNISVFDNLDDFKLAMQQDVVVLMDIGFPGGVHAMKELQLGREFPIPVIFISAQPEFDVRLDAVRAGGVAFLIKPVNIGCLIDKLDSLTSTRQVAPYRVMIVDDSAPLTAYYGAVLEYAGMEVRSVNDPLLALEPLMAFSPNLILIDIHMPGCNGMELARVIRQLNAFVSIPIVYLSAESNLDMQLWAMSLGGDDFLTKPIAPEHLVSSVSSRIQRSLLLRSFMVRDSLTGLLNHTAIKEHLAHEIAHAKRSSKPLSFAMLDIDFFKKVNDTYGHTVGDRVIKSLSRLLKQRLRVNDLVGRYGGEEFAVVLVDTDGAAATKVLDAIRLDFAHFRHLTDGTEFFTTFSCGVAELVQFIDAAKLCDAADKAMYQAKHAGRNQVMLASNPGSAQKSI